VNITELLASLQAQHDETGDRARELRDQIEHLTTALTETEARLAELTTTQKVIAELAPAGNEPEPPETNTAYQAIVNAFNQHPDQEFRARELHELLGMPTDEASVNTTRSRLGRLTRQGFLTQPGRGRYQKRT
jgi:chromosome segregation ATPase